MRNIVSKDITLNNSIIFVFNNGQEVDLLGAKAFIENHEWATTYKLSIIFSLFKIE